MIEYRVRGHRGTYQRLSDAREVAEQQMAGLADDDFVMIEAKEPGEDFFEPYGRIERENDRFALRR